MKARVDICTPSAIRVVNGIARVSLGGGKVALIDPADVPLVRPYRWRIRREKHTSYARTEMGRGAGRRTVYLHRFLLGAAPEQLCDHINHNGLDNRRGNLRLCTALQNQGNRRPQGGSSRFKGVYWCEQHQRFIARASVGGVRRHLGSFLTEEEAARAYDAAAREQFGEFALTNFGRTE